MARPAKRGSSRGAKNKPSVVLWFIACLLLAIFVMGLYYLDVFQSVTHTKKPTTAITPHKTASPNAPQFDFYTILGGQGQQQAPVKSAQPVVTAPAKTKEIKTMPSTVTINNAKTNATVTTPTTPKHYLAPVETAKPLPLPKQMSKHENKPSAAIATAETPTPAPAKEVSTYYLLQIAAVKKAEDADQMKAQLALLGYDVNVSLSTIKGASWYRITVGPYPSLAAAQAAQKKLQNYHIKTILHKAK